MEVYSCIVSIVTGDGIVLTEVERPLVSAAEVMLLRELHGHDRVRSIRRVGVSKLTSAQERARLRSLYSSDAARGTIDRLFGSASYGELPVTIPVHLEAPPAEPDVPVLDTGAVTLMLAPEVVTRFDADKPADKSVDDDVESLVKELRSLSETGDVSDPGHERNKKSVVARSYFTQPDLPDEELTN